MKRTIKRKDGQNKFRKTGKGTLRLSSGKVVKGGEVFYAYPEEIPEAFRDTIELLDTKQEATKETFKDHGVVEDESPKYSLDMVGPGWFNIVDKHGKVVNEKKMRKQEAEEQLKALNE